MRYRERVLSILYISRSIYITSSDQCLSRFLLNPNLQLYVYSYVDNLLILKNNIPASIPAVSSCFSLLVSSFAEGSIQADLLLSRDSVANLF